jgi:hypothetical protein
MTNNTTKTNNMKKTQTRKNKAWLRNPNQRKNQKVFTAKFIQRKDGSFHMIGGESKAYIRKNQNGGEWVNVDTRDLATELRMRGVRSF